MAIATASLVIAASAPGLAVSIESVPNPRREGGWISDGANILSPSTEATINAEIQALESATSAEVAVVTVTDTKGGAETPKRFAHDLFNTWGIGKAGKNNGVLVLIAKDDRRVEIEVGRGLTDKLTGDRIKEILNAKVTPAFKQGHYDSGTMEGTKAVIQAIQSKSVATSDVAGAKIKDVTEKAQSVASNPVVSSGSSASSSPNLGGLLLLISMIGVPIGLFYVIRWLINRPSDGQLSQRHYSGPRSYGSFSSGSNYSSNTNYFGSSSDNSSSSDYFSSSSNDSSGSDYSSSSSDSGSSSDFEGGSSDSSSGGGSDW
jgi:uncharacterized protein